MGGGGAGAGPGAGGRPQHGGGRGGGQPDEARGQASGVRDINYGMSRSGHRYMSYVIAMQCCNVIAMQLGEHMTVTVTDRT